MDDGSPHMLWARAFPFSHSGRYLPITRVRSKWGFDGHCVERHGRSMSCYTVFSMSMRPHWQRFEVRTNRQVIDTYRHDRETLASYRDPIDAILARHTAEE